MTVAAKGGYLFDKNIKVERDRAPLCIVSEVVAKVSELDSSELVFSRFAHACSFRVACLFQCFRWTFAFPIFVHVRRVDVSFPRVPLSFYGLRSP